MGLTRSSSLVRKLRRLLGSHGVHTSPSLATCAGDATHLTGWAEAVLFPHTTENVAAVADFCHRLGVPITARGAGTDLSGGAVPFGGVVVTFTQMNHILAVDPLNRIAVVEPGVVNRALQREAERCGLMYAPDPASQNVSTLGGNAAKGAGGMRAFKYGVTKDHVLGLQVVLADGTVGFVGGHLPNRPLAGPDFTGLLIGSEGTLALITRLILRLVPKPQAQRTMLASFASVEQAGAAVSTMVARGILPATLELMDADCLEAIEDFAHADLPTQAAAVLLIEVDGPEAGLDRIALDVERACRSAGAGDMRVARSVEERDRLWLARRAALGAMARLKPAYDLGDITVPRDRLVEMLVGVADVKAQYGLRIPILAHAGDGNLHPTIVYDDRDPSETARVQSAREELYRRALALGGTLSGEHGIGSLKRDYLHWLYPPGTLEVMKRVKLALDPRGILNPDKVLPTEDHDEAATMPEPGADIGRMGTIVGPRHLVCGEHVRRCLGREPTTWVRPEGEQQISELLAWASESATPVYPAGGLTSWRAAFKPFSGGIGLDLTGLRDVVDVNAGNLTVTAGAGLTHTALDKALAACGLYLPSEGPLPSLSTLGGEMALDCAGPRRLAYGSFRNWVLGCRAVFAQGTTGVFGGRQAKNASGYNISRLLCGSGGSLAVITEVTLRLRPRPPESKVVLAAGTPEQVIGAAWEAGLSVPALVAAEALWGSPAAALMTALAEPIPWARPADRRGKDAALLVVILEGQAEDVSTGEVALARTVLPSRPGLRVCVLELPTDRFVEVYRQALVGGEDTSADCWHVGVPQAELAQVLLRLADTETILGFVAHAATGQAELLMRRDWQAGASSSGWPLEAVSIVGAHGGYLIPDDAALGCSATQISPTSALERSLWISLKDSLDPAGILSPAGRLKQL